MECHLCHGDACEHPRLSVKGNIYECIDCGQASANTPPMKYALPFYEDKVNWDSEVYFPVCRNCYYEYTHDPRAYPLNKLVSPTPNGGGGELMSNEDRKPLGIKSYGSIALLPNSRVTPADHHCHEGQARIATEKARDRHDEIIVQEKLDGSNVGVALLNGEIIAITRAGYRAETSPFEQHWHWGKWVKANENRFRCVLEEGERLCGEWIMQAHGTRYNLLHEPLVVFDIMKGHDRLPFSEFEDRVKRAYFITPHLLHQGQPISVNTALERLGKYGYHGAIDEVEGAVWRVQRRGKVDFLVKYLKPYKEDGIYLPEKSGKEAVWNWYPYGYTLA